MNLSIFCLSLRGYILILHSKINIKPINIAMKKLLLLFAVLLSTVSAWAQSFTLQKSTDKGNPEYQYFIQNANSVFMDSQTSFVSAEKSNSSGKFAFFAYDADGATENDVLIYSIDANKWVSYTKADSYDNKTDFVELEENKEDANPWRFSKNTNGSEAVYQFAPHNSTGIASKYMNWFQGVGDAQKNKTVGIYSNAANSDNGSAWILWPVNGKWRCYLKDVHNKYLNLSALGQDPDHAEENQLATLTLEQAALYISVASDGRWQIHTDENGGNYLKQSSTTTKNSWVSEGEDAFCWTPEYYTLSGQRYLVLRNTSGQSNGYLGCTNHTAGEPLYVDNNTDAKKLKLKMIDGNAEFAHITYKFVYKGQEKATEEYYMPVGSTFPSVQTVFPDYIHCNPVPTGNVDLACNGKTYVLNLYDEMPFQVSDSYANAVWYYMNIRSTGNNNSDHSKPNKWVKMSDGVTYYTNTYGEKPTTDDAQWAFIGNPFDGIKVINKAAGANKTLSLNGVNIVMKEEQKVWNLQKGTGGFVLQAEKNTNTYAHDLSSSLKTWSDNNAKTDAGSAFNVIDVRSDALEYATNVILGSKITDLATIQDGQTVVFKSVPHSKYINISTALETGISSTLSGLSVFKIHVVDAETKKFTFESCSEGYYFPDITRGGSQNVYMDETDTPNQYTILSEATDNTTTLSEGEFVIKSLGTNGGYFDVQDGNDFCGWEGKGNNSKYEIYPVTVLGTTSAGVVNHCVLTDDDNNIYQYDYWAMPGTNPTISGIPSSCITNGSWNDKTYTADVSFPFPVSKTDGTADVSVLISGWRGTKDECYFKYYVDGSNVKVTSVSPTSTNASNFEWSIYPHLIGGDFRFIIKNLGTGKYIQTSATGEATAQGTVTVGDEATATYFNWEENNRFKIVDKNLRLSVTSSSTEDQHLGVDEGHNGCNTFITNTIVYVNNLKTQHKNFFGYVGGYPSTVEDDLNSIDTYKEYLLFVETNEVLTLVAGEKFKIICKDSGRGSMVYSTVDGKGSEEHVFLAGTSSAYFPSKEADGVYDEWAFVTIEGKDYLFNVQNKKFVSLQEGVLKFKENGSAFVLQSIQGPVWALKFDGTGNHYLCFSPGYESEAVRTTGNISDDGNRFYLQKTNENVGDDVLNSMSNLHYQGELDDWKTQNIAVLGYVGAYPATLQNEINAVENYSDIPAFEEGHVEDIIPLKEGYYYIKSVDLSQFAVNDNNGFKASTGGTAEKTAANIWRLVADGDKFKIQSYANGKYVTLREADTPGSPSEIEALLGSASSFSFERSDFAQFKIKDENNKVMRHEGSDKNYVINYWSTDVKYWYLIEAPELPLTIHRTGYSTFSAAVDVEVPGDVTAYYAKEQVGDSYIRMYPVTTIPANEGVVIKGTGYATVNFPIISNAEALPADNLLKAHLNTEAVTPATGSVFILGTRDDVTGFYPLSETNNTIAGHKSYLEIPAQAARLSIVWDDTETGIHEAEGGEQNVEIYDLTGRRLDKPAKGVNIIGGKLVIK